MTFSINSNSSPRCIDGCGLNQLGLGSYMWVTSSSAVPIIPHWPLPPKAIPHWLLPPMASSAPTVPPLALWSRTGIGFTLVLLADFTCLRGMARRFECIHNCRIYSTYIVLYRIVHYNPVSVPQPCLYPTLTPYTTVAFALVIPECDCALTAP